MARWKMSISLRRRESRTGISKNRSRCTPPPSPRCLCSSRRTRGRPQQHHQPAHRRLIGKASPVDAAGIASHRSGRLVRLPEGTQWIHCASIDSLPKGRAKDSPCAYGTGTMSRNTTRRSADSGGVAKSAALSAAPRLPLGDPPARPTFARERAAIRRGVFPVAGCDEAGRGPLAGPVVAAAVILDPNHIPRGLNDSKKLTAVERDKLYERIFATAEVGVAFGSRARIDRDNIRRASLWALARAVAALAV